MAKTVTVYFHNESRRSRIIGEAMYKGIRLSGDPVSLRRSDEYRGPRTDVAVFYGWGGGLRRIFDDYINEGKKAAYIDLGYWGRRLKTKYDGYHKIAVNCRHPVEYFQNTKHDDHRLKTHNIKIEPWRQASEGKQLLLVGMSDKAASAEGFGAEAWERATVNQLKSVTNRKIIYRPKPNFCRAKPIAGTEFQRNVDLNRALCNTHAIVTHHSNVAVDAILAGVPAFTKGGLALPMSNSDFSDIEDVYCPDDETRYQWACDIAYTQFNTLEMEQGTAWRHLRNEELV